jgi:CheY-like chemotaxis protein
MNRPLRSAFHSPMPVFLLISTEIYYPGPTYAGNIPGWNSNDHLNKQSLLMMASLSTGKRIKILLADDDEDDRDLFKEAVEDVKNNADVYTVNDGDTLMRTLTDPDNTPPDVIFLDINMPCKNGQECLKEIRGNKRLKNIPVIIYSTSSRQDLVDNTYKAGANLYVQKPDSYKGIKEITKKILSLKIAELKTKPAKENYFITYNDRM